MSSPDIFDYADHVRFLEDWYQARKDANPRFSHRALARKLHSSDPSAFLNVLKGRRRLTPDRVDDLIRVAGLEDERAEYFRLLVQFGQAVDQEERDRAWAGIADLRSRLRGPEIDSARFLYLSDRLYSVVRSLAECDGFEADPAWIARTLRPPVDEARAIEAIELLERLGFLLREGDRLVPAEPSVRTPERVEALGSYGYHRQSHALARELLERLWDTDSEVAKETAFLGMTLAIPENRLGDLRRALWELQLKVMHLVDSWEEPKDRVVQVGIQMFPASERTN